MPSAHVVLAFSSSAAAAAPMRVRSSSSGRGAAAAAPSTAAAARRAVAAVARPSRRPLGLLLMPLRAQAPGSGGKPAEEGKAGQEDEEEFVGLLPEEDEEIPGNYFDALNKNTKLGKAVAAAVDELEHLNNMEMESIAAAEDILKKLGMKGSLFGEGGRPPAKKKE